MRLRITASSGDLSFYMPILGKFDYIGDDREGTVELNSIQDLLDLKTEIMPPVVLTGFRSDIYLEIYDDYWE